MNPEVQNEVGLRLKCVVGHVHGVRLMVDEDRPALDVLQQLHAIQGSLHVIRKLLFKEQLYDCLRGCESLTLADNADLQKALDQLLQFQDKN